MNYLLASPMTYFCVEHKPKDPLFEDQYTREKLIAILYPAKHPSHDGHFININSCRVGGQWPRFKSPRGNFTNI